MKNIAVVLALLLAAVPADARINPGLFQSLSFRQHPGAQLPLAAQLTDETGKQLTLKQAVGDRPAVLVLEYLRCTNLCSFVLAGAASALAQARLVPGRDVSFVAISIDPRDTFADAASARARYARLWPAGAAQGIHFLTGTPAQVASIASAVGFPYRFDPQSGQFAHPSGFVVTTRAGRISRYILGLNPPSTLVNQAVSEANSGEVEPPAHPLLLLCFGYDPDAGTAAALVMRLVRIGAVATIFACALLVGVLTWRSRRAA